MVSKKITKTYAGFIKVSIESSIDEIKYGPNSSYEPVSFIKNIYIAGIKVMVHTANVKADQVNGLYQSDNNIGFTKKQNKS